MRVPAGIAVVVMTTSCPAPPTVVSHPAPSPHTAMSATPRPMCRGLRLERTGGGSFVSFAAFEVFRGLGLRRGAQEVLGGVCAAVLPVAGVGGLLVVLLATIRVPSSQWGVATR